MDTTVTTLNAATTGAGAGIYINETDNLVVDVVTAGPAGNRGDVVITAGGWIRDLEEANTIYANTLSLVAVTGIGTSGNYLNTAVDNLSAETTGEGADIYIEELDGIDIDELTATGSATITANGSSVLGSITTGGNFNFTTSTGAISVLSGTIESLTGGVNLSALGGSILALGPGPHLIASADSLLQAGGVIANLVQPLDVLLSAGNLSVDIGNAIGGVSGVLTGTTPSGTLVVRNLPPGIVYFNATQIYPPAGAGGPSPELISQSSYLLFWRMILPMLENLARYNNPFTPGGPVFFYHPLTDVDWSAFDQFVLEEGAYEFIEEEIRRRSGR